MGIFPENPCEFAVDFIRKMRNHPDIIQIPSSRQVLSIPRLILSRYYRKGKITPNDYIEICTVTSYPDNQELAKKIAFEILFPNYNKDIIENFFNATKSIKEPDEDFINQELKTELDKIQEMIEEIELSNKIDSETIEKLDSFIDELKQNKDKEPYKSAMHFFNDESELYKEEISSLEKLINEARNRLEQKINSLEPEDIETAVKLGFDELIKKHSLREWEKLTSEALKNQDVSQQLEELLNKGKLNDLIQSLKFMKQAVKDKNFQEYLESIKDQLKDQINTLNQLFNVAKTLEEVPKFDKDKVLENSINQSSFEHNFNVANSLDQYFGTNLRADLLSKYSNNKEKMKMNLSLETLAKNAMANKSWNSLFNQALKNAIQASNAKKFKNEAFKALSHQLQQLMNSCPNVYCSQKIKNKLPEIISKSLETCETPEQLKNTVEFLRKVGLNPLPEDIIKKGKQLNMPEEDIYELVEPNYHLLKKLIEKNRGDFQKISNLLNQIKDQINPERFKELMLNALANNNRDALGALGHFDLKDAILMARQIAGKEGQDKMISCLSAGSGENLLKQWFRYRKEIPEDAKLKVKELAKKMLLDLGIYYSRAHLGTSATGPIPINVVRPYAVGDDFENIDLEETIFNLLEKGKKLDHIEYDDFYVFETAKGLRSACFELDISGSMANEEKLAYLAICTTMLIYGLRKDEIGVAFFESDTHVLKNISDNIDLDKIADEILSVEARGGTRIQSALEWAKKQFKEKANSREKLNVLFTDAEIFDIKQALDELRIFRSLGVDFILVCPEASYNIKEAKKMVKVVGGQLLTVKKWEDFPKLISDIIKSRF